MTSRQPSTERRGDSTVTTLESLGGTLEVYAHDEGGVTLLQRDHRGDEMGRISVVRETWAEIEAAVASR